MKLQIIVFFIAESQIHRKISDRARFYFALLWVMICLRFLLPQAYLEDEYGLVVNGPLERYETIHWYYGQYSQDSLDGVSLANPKLPSLQRPFSHGGLLRESTLSDLSCFRKKISRLFFYLLEVSASLILSTEGYLYGIAESFLRYEPYHRSGLCFAEAF